MKDKKFFYRREKMIYLDYAATTPMRQEAIEVYTEAATSYYGNSSSLHTLGTQAENLLTLCRKKLSLLVNCREDDLFFTSGGTEANYLAIHSLLKGKNDERKHIVTTKLEHSSVLHTLQQLEKEGFSLSYVPVDQNGVVSVDDLKKTLRPDTVLVAIEHITHELGTIQPVEYIGHFLSEKEILFHCDCVQSFGKLPIDVKKLKADSISVSSHKIYGPKGVGMVYMNSSSSWKPIYHKATHEKGFRPGTVNTAGIAAFTAAAECAYAEMKTTRSHYERLKSYLLENLEPLASFIEVEGLGNSHFPGIMGLTFSNIQGQYVMLQCNRHGIAISTGSACQVNQQEPLASLLAIGKSTANAKNFVRISFSQHSTFKHIDRLISVFHLLQQEFIKV